MDILKKVMGAVGDNPLVSSVMGLLSGGDGPGNGISALMQKFTGGGLGDVVQSWIGGGENASVSPDQISAALGQEQIEAMAKESGMQPDEVAKQLSEVLPQAVDKATPDGEIPSSELDLGSITSMIGGLFGK